MASSCRDHAKGASPENGQASKVSSARQKKERPERVGLEALHKFKSLGGASFSRDGERILYTSNESGVYNVYEIGVRGDNGRRLTDSKTDSIFSQSYFPADDRILYRKDREGNEKTHLYVLHPDGSTVDLTGDPEVKESFEGFSHDDRFFYASNNRRDPRAFDLYKWKIEPETKDMSAEIVFENDLDSPFSIGPISRDGKKLALTRVVGNGSNELYVRDLESEETILAAGADLKGRHSPQTFSPRGDMLYYLSDGRGEFMDLVRFDLAGETRETVGDFKWDVISADFSRLGTFIIVVVNLDGRPAVSVTKVGNGQSIILPEPPGETISGVVFSRDEDLMAFYAGSDVSARSLYAYDRSAGESRLLASADNPEIDKSSLVESERISFAARDGLTIPGFLYRPIGAGPDNRAPAIVYVHGGPGGQSGPGYKPGFQYLLGKGYAILAVNNRGSSGYGKTFYHADDGRHGREPLYDCVDARRYLAGLDWIDPDRIGIMGRSYGGYMVLAALAFTPEEFAAGVDVFGVSNWVRTLENMPPYWSSFKSHLFEEIGDPAAEREKLEAISPLFHADKISRPLMVVQGGNDVRVIKKESDDIVEAVRANGGVVKYLVFDDEGHGFKKTANELECWREIAGFLDENL